MKDRINSKAKGSKNERSATKAMENWTDFPFTRVPQSGGLRWQGGQNITGDIIPEDMYQLEEFPFSIEVKARKALNFEDLLLPNNSDILKFWAQAKDDAKRVKKIPLLMMRRDRMPREEFYIGIPNKVFIKLQRVLKPTKFLRYNKEIVFMYSREFFKTSYDDVLDILLG